MTSLITIPMTDSRLSLPPYVARARAKPRSTADWVTQFQRYLPLSCLVFSCLSPYKRSPYPRHPSSQIALPDLSPLFTTAVLHLHRPFAFSHGHGRGCRPCYPRKKTKSSAHRMNVILVGTGINRSLKHHIVLPGDPPPFIPRFSTQIRTMHYGKDD